MIVEDEAVCFIGIGAQDINELYEFAIVRRITLHHLCICMYLVLSLFYVPFLFDYFYYALLEGEYVHALIYS